MVGGELGEGVSGWVRECARRGASKPPRPPRFCPFFPPRTPHAARAPHFASPVPACDATRTAAGSVRTSVWGGVSHPLLMRCAARSLALAFRVDTLCDARTQHWTALHGVRSSVRGRQGTLPPPFSALAVSLHHWGCGRVSGVLHVCSALSCACAANGRNATHQSRLLGVSSHTTPLRYPLGPLCVRRKRARCDRALSLCAAACGADGMRPIYGAQRRFVGGALHSVAWYTLAPRHWRPMCACVAHLACATQSAQPVANGAPSGVLEERSKSPTHLDFVRSSPLACVAPAGRRPRRVECAAHASAPQRAYACPGDSASATPLPPFYAPPLFLRRAHVRPPHPPPQALPAAPHQNRRGDEPACQNGDRAVRAHGPQAERAQRPAARPHPGGEWV